MKPIMQTVQGKQGNCFAACVASITELPIETMPNHFKNENGDVDPRWLDEWNEFLKPYGLAMIWADATFCRTPTGYAIAEMAVKVHPWNHAVVCLDGEIVHDPLCPGYEFERYVNWYIFTVPDAYILKECRELLRSAHAIAERQGRDTHWERFAASIRGLSIGSVTARPYKINAYERSVVPEQKAEMKEKL